MATDARSALVAAGNTYNPSLIVLRERGYQLWIEAGEDDAPLWCARKGPQTFLAYTGTELLGLVTLWEHLGEDWNRQVPDILGELADADGGPRGDGPDGST